MMVNSTFWQAEASGGALVSQDYQIRHRNRFAAFWRISAYKLECGTNPTFYIGALSPVASYERPPAHTSRRG